MTRKDYQSYPFVDTAVGNRLLLGFIADPAAVQRRLPPPWRIASLPAFEAVGLPAEYQPNLLLAFHHLLLDQDLTFRVTVPVLADLFDGKERLVAIIGNPHYMRRVFSLSK